MRSGPHLLKCTCKYGIINSGSFAIAEKARRESAIHIHMMVLQVSKYGIIPVDFIKYFSENSGK
jgi:ferritin-like protein